MPELHITETQQERFETLREELAAEHAGPYATVQPQDVVDYLLDLAESVEEPDRRVDAPAGDDGGDAPGETAVGGSDEESTADDEATATADDDGSPLPDPAADGDLDGGPGGLLNLLERHDDKWRAADGDERYEVELEDGSVETARTKDDVKAILFEHY